MGAVALVGVYLAPAVQAEVVLKVAPHADLRILDPHAGTATISLMHSQLVYDELFAWDEQLKPKPQMVETYTISEDKKTYSFTLRPGLKFHDGQPVTTRDVIPSLKRWMIRDAMGQKLASYVSGMEAVDDKTFKMVLKEPFAFVELALGASNGSPPVIMREKEAMTDPFTQIKEVVGSGPFRFVADQWQPGAKVVYAKFADYVPRAEPPSGLAGGKVVKFDRMEWIVLPDPLTKAQALMSGEIDMIDNLPHDQVPILDKASGITVRPVTQLDGYGLLRFNHLHPPFNDVRARQAVALAIDQQEYLAAAYGDAKRWGVECYSFFVCNSPNGTEAGTEGYRKRDLAKAKQLLAASGYKGEKVVVLQTNEIAYIQALGDVSIENLKAIGLNVEVRLTDWGTLLTRRIKKDPPDQGGWSIFHTTVSGAGMYSPLTNFVIDQNCGAKNWFGWPCDDKTQPLLDAYVNAPDEATRAKALDTLHARLWETLPALPVGQYKQPIAWRNNITGVLRANLLTYWNIEKK